MARIFTTGGEELLPRTVWNDENGGYALIQGRSDESYDLSITPRTGFACWRTRHSSAGFVFACYPDLQEIYVGFAVRLYKAWNTNFFLLGSTGAQIGLRCPSNGYLTIYRGGTLIGSITDVMYPNEWVYVEVYLKSLNVGGQLEVKLNGTSVFTFSGDTVGANEWIDQVRFMAPDGAYTYFDDIVINDTTGAENNSWPGQVRLLPASISVAGSLSEWGRRGVDYGSGAAQIRDLSTGSYIEANDVGLVDQFKIEPASLPAGAVITNLIHKPRIRIAAGAGGAKSFVSISGSSQDGESIYPSNGWLPRLSAFPTNPNTGVAWTEADLADVELGMESI